MKDSEKFQMNVEVVSKALQEQAQTREPEEEARKLYKKFTATRQEPVRLAVALRGFFSLRQSRKKGRPTENI